MPDNGLTALSRLFEPQRLHEVNGGCAMITEDARQATLRRLDIVGVGADAVALRFDKAGHATPFTSDKPIRRACDAILFCRFRDQGYILCFDLKSSEPSRDDYVQLVSAQSENNGLPPPKRQAGKSLDLSGRQR